MIPFLANFMGFEYEKISTLISHWWLLIQCLIFILFGHTFMIVMMMMGMRTRERRMGTTFMPSHVLNMHTFICTYTYLVAN